MVVTTAQLSQLSQFNNAALREMAREFRTVRSSLTGVAPERARDALLELSPALVDRHGRVVSAGSATWYEQVRRTEIGGTFTARPVASSDRATIERSVRWAAGALFTATPISAFDALEGVLTRQVGNASRDTITENTRRDRRAVGWHRIAQPDACDFCVMLSQRGAIYRRTTADFASHDHCRCRSAPSWDPSAPEVDVQAYQASERMGSVRRRASDPNLSAADRAKAQRILDRHRKNTREWIDANRWRLDDFRAEL